MFLAPATAAAILPGVPMNATPLPYSATLALVVMALTGLIMFRPGWRSLPDAYKIPLMGFAVLLMVMSANLLVTENMDWGLNKWERYVRLSLMLPITVLLIHRGAQWLPWVLYGAAAGGILNMADALYEVYGMGSPIASGSWHKIVFGDLSVLMALLSLLGLATIAQKRWEQTLCLLGILGGTVASILSYTRGSWLLLPLGILFLAVSLRGKAHWSLPRRVWIPVVVIFALAGGWGAQHVKKGVAHGLSDLQAYQQDNQETSWGLRLVMWKKSWALFLQNPAIGVGLGDLNQEMAKLPESIGGDPRLVKEFNQAHNVFFDLLATTGLIGFLVFCWVVYIAPWRLFFLAAKRADSPHQLFAAVGGQVTLFSFVVFGLSEGWPGRIAFVDTYVILLSVFLAGAAITFHPTKRQNT
ncbi:MAG: O-antigen ligase family protein [Deltaproteobacteria bacterium]|nr:O-antigen ligase family protein [Deltaproteobacteria bacterium]